MEVFGILKLLCKLQPLWTDMKNVGNFNLSILSTCVASFVGSCLRALVEGDAEIFYPRLQQARKV